MVGDWKADGPWLPIEFARESKNKRITLVVCDGAKAVPTFWCYLTASDLDQAIATLASREGTAPRHIGYIAAHKRSHHAVVDVVEKWAASRGVSSVIWTALRPKFNGEDLTPSVDDVLKHLKSLDDESKRLAEEYLRKTPRQIQTSYRIRIERELGWTPIG